MRSEFKSEISELRSELKSEISELRSELKADIAELRSNLKAEISEVKTATVELKADLLKWIIGAVGFQTLVIIGAVVTLGRLIGK